MSPSEILDLIAPEAAVAKRVASWYVSRFVCVPDV
jgi:hypothetical protein